MKLNDSHIHFFRGGYPGPYGVLFPHGGELPLYETIRQIHEVDRALVVGFEGEPWSPGNNDYIAELAPAHPWMAPLAFCNAERPIAPSQLTDWWNQRFLGISLYVDTDAAVRGLLNWSDECIAALNSKQAIVSVNATPEHAARLHPFFARLRETRILLSHLGLPGALPVESERLRLVLDLASLPHLGVKLSAAYAGNPYPHPGLSDLLDALLEAYGDSRLYWGSDFSPALADVTFAQAIEAFRSYSWPNPEKIFSANLQSAIDRVKVEA